MTTKNSSPSYTTTPSAAQIPMALRTSGVLSETSSAPECFINGKFSLKLQAFMISYNMMVMSGNPVYAL